MTRKIKFILLFSLLIILGLCTKSQARITTSDPTVESGGTATITINSQEGVAYGSIDVTSSGGLTFVSVSGGTANGTKVAFAGTENKKSSIATYKFKVPAVTKTTTYKVVFSSADMGTAEGDTVASSSATATVTVKAESSSSGGSSGSNSSSGNSSNSSSSGSGGTTNTQAPSFTTVNETVYVTEDGINVRSSYSTSSKAIGSVNKGDKLTRIGVATTSINGIKWSKVKYNNQTAYITSSYLTTEKPEESNEKNLKSITIDGDYELTPEFDKDVTEYSLTVESNVESLKIDAKAVDDSTKVEITGNEKLLMGENTIEIKVTAEDGTVRTYKINVTKGDDLVNSDFGLSELSIDGYTLSPTFSTNIYEYEINIEDESITKLHVNAKATLEDAIVDIVGNNELKLGENIITVLVKSKDEKQTATYQIIVNISKKVEEKKQIIAGIDDKYLYLYAGIGLGVILLIIIIIALIRHRHKKDEYEEYYEGFNSLNDKTEKKEDNINLNKVNSNLDDDKKVEIKNTKKEEKNDRESIIKKNFGANINYDNIDDKSTKKRGKHF